MENNSRWSEDSIEAPKFNDLYRLAYSTFKKPTEEEKAEEKAEEKVKKPVIIRKFTNYLQWQTSTIRKLNHDNAISEEAKKAARDFNYKCRIRLPKIVQDKKGKIIGRKNYLRYTELVKFWEEREQKRKKRLDKR